ncbi:glutaredoxin [Rhodobacterales bacterium HKCCE4037]|nr:glutaredoxin [Rhodobacterales bacterium HKCCE4037]
MVMEDHVCPYGLKARYRLQTEGYDIDDHWLETREETDAFKEKHNVETTPQIWIGDERIGGFDALREYFGDDVADDSDTSYQPVIAIFAVAALLGAVVGWTAGAVRMFELFIAFSMVMLAVQKLQDVEQFSTMFLNYDLLAKRWVPYGRIYPFGEALAGILMVGGLLPWVSGPVALFIGTIGAVSVFKAVYIDQRELKCACVGGASNVPLGFVSLTENLMMMAMGTWTLLKFGL